MRIDAFFKRQAAHGDTNPTPDAAKRPRTATGSGADCFEPAGSASPADLRTAGDQVKRSAAKMQPSKPTPLGEATNKPPGAAVPTEKPGAASSCKQPTATALESPPRVANGADSTTDLCGDSRAATQQQELQQQQQQDPAAAPAATPQRSTPAGAHEPEHMDVDHTTPAPGAKAPAAAAAGAEATEPAAADKANGPGAQAVPSEPATPAAGLLASSSCAGGATPATAANTASTAKGLPPEAFLTPDQRKQLLAACLQELPLLEAQLGERPDLAEAAAACEAAGVAGSSRRAAAQQDLKHQVSLLVEGQTLPLTQLAHHISSRLSSSSTAGGGSTAGGAAAVPENGDAGSSAEGAGPGGGSAAGGGAGAGAGGAGEGCVSALVVRNLIQEVASRKSYGLQDGALANVDALEDDTACYHWAWELRSLTGLPKQVRSRADTARKQRKQVLERMKACSAFISLARSFTKSTKAAETKVARAAAKLAKLSSLQQLQQEGEAAGAALEAAQAAARAAAAAAKVKAVGQAGQADKAAKEAAKEEAAARKADKQRRAEADKVAREAERAAKAAAKAAEAEDKARLKAEKDAEAAQKREASAAKKEAAQAARRGFSSVNDLHKAQHVFKHFLGMAPKRSSPPAGPSDHSQGTGSQQEGSGAPPAAAAAAVASHSKEAARVWALPAAPSQQQLAEVSVLDAELAAVAGPGSAAPSAAQLMRDLRQHWRRRPPLAPRIRGLPPSWACRPAVRADPLGWLSTTAAALYGEGAELRRLATWRRKLLKHHDSVRPPWYGSCSRTSRRVCGRRPFGRDADLDYEVMSDQDWEEEPEGESLSDEGDEGDEAEPEEGDDDEEGFVVGDGYLSDDEGLGGEDGEGEGEQDQQGVATAAGAAAAGGGGAADRPGLAQLECGLERARARGRPLLLVNNCPGMAWEPTSNLDPSLLASLRGSLLRTDIRPAPVTAADLPHLFGEAAAAAAAAAGTPAATPAAKAAAAAAAAAGTPGGAAAGATPAAAGAAGTPGSAAPGSGRGRPAAPFPAALLPALVAHVHQSTLAMDKLVSSFVEAQAAAGVKVAKARVKAQVKEISCMKMVAKAPLYTVRPEVLAAVAQQQQQQQQQAEAGGPGAGAGDEATAAAGAGAGDVDGMDVDGAEQQQQQQQEKQQPDQQPAAAATAGAKRPAAASESSPAGAAAGGGSAAAAADKADKGPPQKKQKTPGIERFFGSGSKGSTKAVDNLQAAQQQQQQQPAKQQQQDHGDGPPPSTPKHQKLQSRLHFSPPPPSAAAAGGGGGAGAAAAAADYSGVLPMLTPPSDVAAERPGKDNSPVPFRLGLPGGDATHAAAPQQQQNQQQQQQAAAPVAAAARAGSSIMREPPQLPADGSLPGVAFWREMAKWVASVQQPSQADVEAAFKVFSEGRLDDCISSMPQMVLSGMVKTLGSASQALPMRAGCARCISHVVQCLARQQQQAQQQQQQQAQEGASAPAASNQAAQSPAAAGTPGSSSVQQQQRHPQQQAAAAAQQGRRGGSSTPSPSPGSSPRSSPAGVSFEELCAEPGLLPNLLACMSPAKVITAARGAAAAAAAGAAGGGGAARAGLGPGAEQEAASLAQNAARALAALLQVGVPAALPAAAGGGCEWHEGVGASATSAAAGLRLVVASVNTWRSAIKNAIMQREDNARSVYGCMALHALLSDPAAASQVIANDRLAKLMVSTAACRGADPATKWVVRKWCLNVLSALLADETFQSWALPGNKPMVGLVMGADEVTAAAAALGELLSAVLTRPADLSQPGPDRAIATKALQLARLLARFVSRQHSLCRTGPGGGLPRRLADIFAEDCQDQPGAEQQGQEDEAGKGLLSALQEVAMQDEWEEAAVAARQLLQELNSPDEAAPAGADDMQE